MKLGLVPTPPRYYGPHWPFADPMRQCSGEIGPVSAPGPWTIFGPGGMNYDAQGYPVLAPGQTAETVTFAAPGDYAVTWDGAGTVAVSGAAIVRLATSQSFAARVPAGQLPIQITASDPSNPVRNVRMTPILDPPALFHPQYLAGYDPFPGPIRFLGWTWTDSYPAYGWSRWSDRTTPYYSSQFRRIHPLADGTGAPLADTSSTPNRPYLSGAGVCLEYQIELCNTLNRDGWWNITHTATDEYVYGMLSLINSQLKPGLKAYIETGNEIWNFNYKGTQFCDGMGTAAGDSKHPVKTGKAMLIKRFFTIADQVFGVQNAGARYSRVLASWLYQPTEASVVFGILQSLGYTGIDAVAVAPYIFVPAPVLKTYTAATTTAQILADAGAYLSAGQTADIQTVAAFVKSLSSTLGKPIEFCAYEFGNELVSAGTVCPQAFLDAQSDPGLGGLYVQLLTIMEKAGMSFGCHCVDFGPKTNCYSLRYSQTDAWDSNPKALALSAWANS